MDFEHFISSGNEKIDSLLKFSAFIDELCKIKRRTIHIFSSERENDAEHSWHIATMALLFADFAAEKMNVEKSVKMCLVHDLVELYAGDTFAYDEAALASQKEREKNAADKIFAMIPNEIGQELRTLWEEFDEKQSAEAKYAASMDSLQPFLHNALTGGFTWKEGGVHRSQVEKRLKTAMDFLPKIAPWIEKNIDKAVSDGTLKPL